MPLYKKINFDKQSVLLIWKIEEDYNFLMKNVTLTEYSKKKIISFSSIKRKKEYLITRILLQKIGYSDVDLYYSSSGAPKIKNKYISISHSSEYVAISISDKHVGIDIETIRDKLKHVSSKYINAHEKEKFNTSSLLTLSIVWSCKEAMFKIEDTQNKLDFKSNLHVSSINFTKNTIQSSIIIGNNTKELKGHFYTFDNHTLVHLQYT